MNMRALLLTSLLAACGGHHGHLRVDSPVTPYEKPDISEITGIEEEDTTSTEEATPAPAATPTPTPAPAPAKK